jgi:hypothetical protein
MDCGKVRPMVARILSLIRCVAVADCNKIMSVTTAYLL